MNNKQLVTEKTPCVEAISLAKAKDYVIPKFIQQKAIIRLKARFHVLNEGYQCLAKRRFGRFDICLRSTT